MKWMWMVLVVAGCEDGTEAWSTVAPAELEVGHTPGTVLPPPGNLLLDVSGPSAPGDTVVVTIEGVPAGDTARIVMSTRGPGLGPCPAALGGLCLDVKRPSQVGSGVADNAGVATIDLTIPAGVAPGASFWLQGVAAGQAPDTSNVVEVLVDSPPPPIGYVTDVEPILVAHCNGCHIGGASGGFTATYANIADKPSGDVPAMPRADCAGGSVDNSYLWHKLSGTQAQAGGNGSRMPLGGPFLGASDMDVIQEWIETGCAP